MDDRFDTRILATEKSKLQSEQDTIPGVVQPGIHNNNITVSLYLISLYFNLVIKCKQ